jgi:hypothetical protein
MKQYTYHAIINNIEIESNNIDVLVENINNTIGFPIVTRDSVFNYFNRPERMKSKLKAYEYLTLSRDLVLSKSQKPKSR